MSIWVLPCVLSVSLSVFLVAILYWKKSEGPMLRALIPLLLVVSWIQSFNAMTISFLDDLVIWKKLILLGEFAFPVVLGFVSQSFFHHTVSNPKSFGHWWWKIIGVVAVMLGGSVLIFSDEVMQQNEQYSIVFSKPVGLVVWSYVLIALVVGLSQLEQLLRASRDPLRYQFKFVLIGLGGLTGISIVQASQLILYPVWDQGFVWVGGTAAFISLVLVSYGLGRWRVHDFSQKVQLSHHALYTSLTLLGVGGYLIVVGVVAEVIQQTGWEIKEALGVLLLFIASLGLVLVLVSRHARAEVHQFVGRHFFRSKYDYREKWLEVTDVFSACQDIQDIWDCSLQWLGRTFGAPRITIWKKFEVDGRFHQIRSMNTEAPPSSISENHSVVLEMIEQKDPIVIHQPGEDDLDLGDFLHLTQAHVCIPLAEEDGRLIGFCTLSHDLHRRPYDQDDFALLRAMAHHVTMLLVQSQLIEERTSASKWEAVHRFSGFYLHDLKNLASSLSMVVQNAERYGQDQEFQASAMRTVQQTSQRIMDLMGKLANQSKEPRATGTSGTEEVDINELIQDMLEALNGAGCKPSFHPSKDLPVLHLNVESMKQVFLNLILNARQAMDRNGTITISTSYEGEEMLIEIRDTGPGIPSTQLEHLFQPFRSSKKNGLGVGLFQCKRMVEDQQGRIRIESQEGQGTAVQITFPVTIADKVYTLVP